MLRRLLPLGIAVLIFGAAVAMSASKTEAQSVSPAPIYVASCDIPRYDLSGDRTLSKEDILIWLDRVESRGCPLGGSATEGCAELDMNGDGLINFDDPRTIYVHFLACVQGSIVVDGPR